MRHAAKLGTSTRLQKVMAVLEDGRWHGTFDIMSKTKLCAVGSAISELRANYKNIETRCIGQGLYEYKLCEHIGDKVDNDIDYLEFDEIELKEVL